MNKFKTLAALALALGVLALPDLPAARAQAPAPSGSRYFPETGHTVTGRFLEYWEQHGGLAQQGFPLSEELQETSDTDGKLYTVQYFERAVFEHHPEKAPPYDVLLSLLGVFAYHAKYTGGAPGQLPNSDPSAMFFPQTGKRLGGTFLAYWRSRGGLAQQGYPLSDEFSEISPLNSQPYTVQYFERAVFEYHPENKGTPYEVLLSQLGTFRYRTKQNPPQLGIPAPAAGRIQFGPRASAAYLVWGEAAYAPGQGAAPDSFDIQGLDLRTNTPLTVTDAPNNQTAPAISGSLVVWQDNTHGDRDILGKDLAGGATFAVATGPADQVSPAIAGKTVAWIENANQATRLLTKDLDTGKTDEITALPSATNTLAEPLLSDEYLVWTQMAPGSGQGFHPVDLRAYARKTGLVKTIAHYGVTNGGVPQYALDGHRVVWVDGALLKFADLSSGEASDLVQGAIQAPAIHGDLVLWSMRQGPSSEGSHLWGLHLTDQQPRLLVSGAGSQVGGTIAGDWLVWANQGGPDDGRLGATPLAAAFAAAPPP